MSALAELSPLEARALLAYVDQKAEAENYLERVAQDLARDILKAEEIVVTDINLNARCAFFMVDEMKFRAESKITTDTSSNSNPTIEGIHEDESRFLHFHRNETWYPITELSDLGRLLVPLASAKASTPAPVNYGPQR